MWAATLACCAIVAACGPAKDDRIVADAKARSKAWSTAQGAQDAARAAAEQAAAVAAIKAAPDCTPSPFKFVPDERLSVAELVSLGEEPPTQVEGRRLVFLGFDYEAPSARGDWVAVGVLYVRGDPPDRRTIGGVLWSRNPNFRGDNSEIIKGPEGDVLNVSLVPTYADDTETKIACVGRFRAVLSPDGTLTAGGKKVGVFH